MGSLLSFLRGNNGGSPTISAADIEAAHSRVRTYFDPTPLILSPGFSEKFKCEVYLKWDSQLSTGSFKERGVINFLSLLSANEKSRGVCAASAGNHALALSLYARKLGIPALIVMPLAAPLVKVQSTRAHGAEVLLHGATFHEAYAHAEELAKKRGFIFVPPFDDPRVVAGQASCGVEICAQLDSFDAIYVPVGGGGLVSGIALALKERRPDTQIIGAESAWAAALREPGHATRKVGAVTIADGIAVKTRGKYTTPIIETHVSKMVTLNEEQIADAIIDLLKVERSVVEGAGAAGVAALLASPPQPAWKRVVVVISGSNIDLNLLSRLIERGMAKEGRLLTLQVSIPDTPGSLQSTTGIIAKAGGNILQVLHDRSYSRAPGNVEVTFSMEIRDRNHQDEIIAGLHSAGLGVCVLSSNW